MLVVILNNINRLELSILNVDPKSFTEELDVGEEEVLRTPGVLAQARTELPRTEKGRK